MKKTAILLAAAGLMLCGCELEQAQTDNEKTAESRRNALIQPVSANMAVKPTVVIDPGHGGMDGGGVSVNNVPEKGINLNIALGLSDMLRLMGYEVKLTRTDDRSIHDDGVEGLREQKLSDMKNRLEMFNTPDAVCISIHQNRFTDPKYHGAQMFYYKDNSQAGRLAENLRLRIKGLLQPDNERETKAMDDELYLLKNCVNPAVMAECGFLSNPEEANLLEHEPYQKEISFALMCGINDYHIESGRISEKNRENSR
ncbi:MAG: N-acetylmuramoyl-L-alanine amidase [Ruminococcus sp.]|nr:N-acetylmuramoyl-L-alanine amidase [Ruminococcus sp.]